MEESFYVPIVMEWGRCAVLFAKVPECSWDGLVLHITEVSGCVRTA